MCVPGHSVWRPENHFWFPPNTTWDSEVHSRSGLAVGPQKHSKIPAYSRMSCTGIIRHAPFSACPLSPGTIFWSSPMVHVPVTHSFSGAQLRNHGWICQFIQSLLFLGAGCYEQRCYISLPNNVLNILVSRGQTPGNGAVEQEWGVDIYSSCKRFLPTQPHSKHRLQLHVLAADLSLKSQPLWCVGNDISLWFKFAFPLWKWFEGFFFIWLHLVTYILSFIKLLLKDFFSF